MRRILFVVALAALSVGCATPGGAPSHRLGAVNNYTSPPCETLTLGVSTIHSVARLTLSVDTLSVSNVLLSGTPSGTLSFEGSNDNSNWFPITLPATPPPLVSGSPASVPISYEGGWAFAYWRETYVGTGGSGTLQVCTVLKG
jgi:hypothetical protein